MSKRGHYLGGHSIVGPGYNRPLDPAMDKTIIKVHDPRPKKKKNKQEKSYGSVKSKYLHQVISCYVAGNRSPSFPSPFTNKIAEEVYQFKNTWEWACNQPGFRNIYIQKLSRKMAKLHIRKRTLERQISDVYGEIDRIDKTLKSLK